MLQQKVLQTIKQNNLINENDKIVIGVSGGPDSMCLLDILYCLKQDLHIKLAVAHINHMIRKEAEQETKYVQEFCKKIDVPCYTKYAEVEILAKQQKVGTEEMGRKVRYEFFEEVAKKEGATKIATAHNANDNSETIIMNLLRGTSISGLKGIEIMHKSATNPNLDYIRPLKESTRAEIEAYCKKHNLNPKIDKTNFENVYTRNKIRNELIPYLQKEFNPNIIQTLNRLSSIAQQNEEYFAQIVQTQYETLKIGETEKEIILNLKEFNKLPKVIKTRLLLYTINKLTKTVQGIQMVNLEDMIKLCENNIGNKYLMPNKNVKIFVGHGNLHIINSSN